MGMADIMSAWETGITRTCQAMYNLGHNFTHLLDKRFRSGGFMV